MTMYYSCCSRQSQPPGLRCACFQFISCVAVALLASIAYYLVAAWIYNEAVPILWRHHEDVQSERWRNRAAFYGRACNNDSSKFVVINCNQTFQSLEADHLKDTLHRSLKQLASEDSLVFNQWLQCDALDGTCASFTYQAAEAVRAYPWLPFGLVSFANALLWGLALYAKRKWNKIDELTPKTPAEEFSSLSSPKLKEEYTAALAERLVTGNQHEFGMWKTPTFAWPDGREASDERKEIEEVVSEDYNDEPNPDYQHHQPATRVRRSRMAEL